MKAQFHIDPITNNFLDKSFQNTLLPFQCLQHMLFISRFSIKYNCIRPHRVSYYIVSFIGTLGFILFHIDNLLAKEFEEATRQFVVVFVKFNVVFLVIPFMLFFTLNIIQRKEHVLLILEIQRAFRLINYKNYKKSIKRNWIGVVRHFFFYFIGVSLTRNFKLAIYFYSLVYFDVNLTYSVSIIALIRDGIISWISEIEHYSVLSLELEDDKYNDKLKKLFQAYVHLLGAYDIFKKIFKFSALFQGLNTFILGILYLQTLIELNRSEATHYGTYDLTTFTYVTILWVIKNIAFVSIFSGNCEKFYTSVSEADAACCRLLRSLQSTVEAKRLCKNVLRVSRAEFEKMTACRVFTIDGRLPQDFNHLILQYMCLTVQFAIISIIKHNKNKLE